MYKHVHSYIHTHAIALTEIVYTHTLTHTVDVCAHQQMRTTHKSSQKKEEVEENNQYFRFPFVINPATKKQQLEMEAAAAAENG